MKKFIVFIIACVVVTSSYATHLMGGQISATYLSSDTSGSHYFVELDVYRDTFGVPMMLDQTIEIYELDIVTGTYNLIGVDSMSLGTSGSVATMSSVYGVEIYHFTDSITFPANGYYMIKWSDCCRNGAIINMSSPLAEEMQFLTYINVDSANPNSSPTYLSPPVIYLPANNVWQYNPLPFDPDGDSLVWNLSIPLSNDTTVIGYQFLSDTALYSNATGVFAMDTVTGEITWDPKMVGNFVASFAIEEYRNGVLVGAMSRDMQFVVVPDSTNAVPDVSFMQSPPTNNLGYPYVKIVPGQNYEITLLASDADVNDVVSMDAYGEPFEITNPAIFNVVNTGNGNEIEATFSWTPNMSQLRSKPYVVVFRTTDNFFYFDETIQFEVSLATSVQENNILGIMDIYPNPANNNFSLPINLDQGQRIRLDIYNILGVKVSSEVLNLASGNHILVKNFDLTSGQYFVNLSDEKGIAITTKKLVVVK
ncbi:MAG: T9SS type A sorting domain-containing protein [Bacteroidota bacterium]|nr:T9SS type A sorting domain-containing protein [Bacteroidota bacterium]